MGFATSTWAMLWSREHEIWSDLYRAYDSQSQLDWIAACTQDSMAGLGWLCTYAGNYGFLPAVVGGLATVVMTALVFCTHVSPAFSRSSVWTWISSLAAGVLMLGGTWYLLQGMGDMGALLSITIVLIASLAWFWRSMTPSFRKLTLAYVALQTVLWGLFLVGSHQLIQHERRPYDTKIYLMHHEQARQAANEEAASPDKKSPNQHTP